MSKTPWESVPHLWKTEKNFLNWMRSQVRKVWSRHPVKNNYISSKENYTIDKAKSLGLKMKKVTKSHKKVRQCECCSYWYPPAELEIDHIHGGKGFSDWEGFTEWQRRMLWVGFDDIREVCKDCHADITLMQKLKITKEQLPIEKERIGFKKMSAADQKKLLNKLKLDYGKNSQERISTYIKYLETKHDDKN